ncbi:MAG: tetratricopeptide repeat protein [Anaerolineae bacterium]|nr:tetratricopeptide repeat protein [Anaerolineae bacterium]
MTDSQKHDGKSDTNHKPDDAARLDQELEKLSEEQFRRQMRQASVLLSGGNAKEAIPLLERCHSLHPEDVNVLTNLGGAYILHGQHRYAVPVLEKASELAPHNPNVWSNLAAAYLGKLVTSTRAKQEQALVAYQRVIELDGAYPNVHYNMGLIYVDRREWDEAHAAFSRALEMNPYDQDAQTMLRQVEDVQNRPDDPEMN